MLHTRSPFVQRKGGFTREHGVVHWRRSAGALPNTDFGCRQVMNWRKHAANGLPGTVGRYAVGVNPLATLPAAVHLCCRPITDERPDGRACSPTGKLTQQEPPRDRRGPCIGRLIDRRIGASPGRSSGAGRGRDADVRHVGVAGADPLDGRSTAGLRHGCRHELPGGLGQRTGNARAGWRGRANPRTCG